MPCSCGHLATCRPRLPCLSSLNVLPTQFQAACQAACATRPALSRSISSPLQKRCLTPPPPPPTFPALAPPPAPPPARTPPRPPAPPAPPYPHPPAQKGPHPPPPPPPLFCRRRRRRHRPRCRRHHYRHPYCHILVSPRLHSRLTTSPDDGERDRC